MAFTRTTTINSAPGGDSVKQAVLDLDTDLTGAFGHLNTHDHVGGDGAQIAYSSLSGLPTLGTIASQAANSIAITGGSINNTAIGSTTPSTGAFTTLQVNGSTYSVGLTVRGSSQDHGGGITLIDLYNSNNRYSIVGGGGGALYLGQTTDGSTYTTRLYVSSTGLSVTGNVLIDTTTDDGVNKLQVNGDATFAGTKINLGGQGNTWHSEFKTISLYGGYGTIYGSSFYTGDGVNTGQMCIVNNAYYGPDSRMRSSLGGPASSIILGSGKVYVFTHSDVAAGAETVVTAGPYVANGGTAWSSPSDERLKDVTGAIKDALTKISQLRAVEFTWKYSDNKEQCVGLIAQDVIKVIPSAVTEGVNINNANDKTNYMGVSYTDIIPVLVAAIQELNDKLDAHIQGV